MLLRWRARLFSALWLPASYERIISGPTNETICIVTIKSEPPTVDSKASVARVGKNVEVVSFSPKSQVPFRTTTEHIFSAGLEISLIIDELIIGRRTPAGTRYGIGEFGEH